jgi:predicted dehydrogenase
MHPSPLAAAVVGTGFIGPVHVEALRRLGRTVHAVVGSRPERGRDAARRLGIARSYDSLDAMLPDPAVQVVHLASPNRLHFEQCKKVLAARRHVVCEKPLAMTSAETAELLALAARTPVVAAVCYNNRFYPLCLEARARIRAGDLGTIYHVTGSYLQDWLLYDTDFNWRVLAEDGGALRAVADIGTHWLDLVTFVTGLEIESVCADLRTFLPVRQRPRGSVETFAGKMSTQRQTEPVAIATEDHGSLLLRFRNGAAGACTVSQVSAGRKNQVRFEIAGSNGSLAWDSERPNELWLGRRDRANELLLRDPALLRDDPRRYTDYPGGHNEGFPDTFKQMFRAVYAAAEGRPAGPFATFADGHREVVLCEKVLQSHRERRWVDVPSTQTDP